MKAREIREKTDDELRQLLQERSAALVSFRMQLVTGQVENVRSARNARKDIARIKTILHERTLQAERKAD
ncbi:MAG: 50S ribosomal protein L29 [FCB group bacterium]|nr:50S ribosomal protein L29 [FCB group bacterium]